jgi:hypothetical protein
MARSEACVLSLGGAARLIEVAQLGREVRVVDVALDQAHDERLQGVCHLRVQYWTASSHLTLILSAKVRAVQ